jgi:hypothetical protein
MRAWRRPTCEVRYGNLLTARLTRPTALANLENNWSYSDRRILPLVRDHTTRLLLGKDSVPVILR